MIYLDEQFIGHDQNSIMIRSIILCGGLVGRLSNGGLIGAHFDPVIPANIITAGLNHIQANWYGGGHVTEAFFIYRAASWTQRADALSDPAGLVAHLRAGLGAGPGTAIHLVDKAALSLNGAIDIRAVDAGNAMLLTWRDHPGGPNTPAPTPNVMYLPNVNPPVIQAPAGGHLHMASADTGGWNHLANVQ